MRHKIKLDMATQEVNQSQMRNMFITLNNWNEDEYNKLINMKGVKYYVLGKEVGAEGTPHLQGYFEFTGGKRFSTIKKLIPRLHIEKRKGTAQQAAEYCKKEGDYVEFGELSHQGERKDLDEIKDAILKGKKVDDIVIDTPMLYHQYGRTLHKIEDITLRKKYRNWMTKGTWIIGKTGSGKSHKAFENYNPDTHYLWKLDEKTGWQDGYTGQEIIIINDFRGEIKYSQLLRLIDKYPETITRRGREPAPLLAKEIIITSTLLPWEVYHNLAENDTLEQLIRRLDIYVMQDNHTMIPYNGLMPSSSQANLGIIKSEESLPL